MNKIKRTCALLCTITLVILLLIGLAAVVGRQMAAGDTILFAGGTVYDANGDIDSHQLILMDSATGMRTRIDTVHEFGSEAGWSPGGRFVYVLDQIDDETRHLRLIDIETHRTQTLTENVNPQLCSIPVWWSGDDRFLTYQTVDASSQHLGWQIYDSVTMQTTELGTSGEYQQITWSPNNRHLFMPIKGGDPQPYILWDALEQKALGLPDLSYVRRENWSPDGRFLALDATLTDNVRVSRVMVVDTVTGIIHDVIPAAAVRWLGSWSPTTNHLLITINTQPPRVHIFDADEGTVQTIAGADESDEMRWSPDGTQIALQHQDEDATQVSIWDMTRGEITQAYHVEPVVMAYSGYWSPNSRYYHLYGRSDEDSYSQTIIDTNAQRISATTDSSSEAYNFRWSPDGTHLTFVLYENSDYSDVAVVESATGQERLVLTDVRTLLGYGVPIRWSSGSRALAFENRQGAMIYDLSNGQFHELGPGGGGYWLDDGDMLRFWSQRGGERVLSIFDLDTGQIRLASDEMRRATVTSGVSRHSGRILGLTHCGVG